MTDSTPTPPTYPARPVNGGPLPLAAEKHGEWSYEPKYNGWRALVHTPTGTMFNRKGERLTIEKEFTKALALLQPMPFEWLDCEALERRHGIGRGTLIIIDYINPIKHTYAERREVLEFHFETALMHPDNIPSHGLLLPPNDCSPLTCWEEFQRLNRQVGCEFYEGLVAKRNDSLYPSQLISPERECPYWMKHRWAW